MEEEARLRLKKADSWHEDPNSPGNFFATNNPYHFNELCRGTTNLSNVVVAYFFSPSCLACRAMWPKLKQIAKNNPDTTFIKVNTAVSELGKFAAEVLEVPKVPYFLIIDGETNSIISRFTCNLTTIDLLRAEIASEKYCYAPRCAEDVP